MFFLHLILFLIVYFINRHYNKTERGMTDDGKETFRNQGKN